MRTFVTALLVILVMFSIYLTFINFSMIDEFEKHKSITGTLEQFYSKRERNGRHRTTNYYVKLNEYPTIFDFRGASKHSFDHKGFNELKQGTVVHFRVREDFDSSIHESTTPSEAWTSDQEFIDKNIRNKDRKITGTLACIMIFVFSGGLIHHLKRPWI